MSTVPPLTVYIVLLHSLLPRKERCFATILTELRSEQKPEQRPENYCTTSGSNPCLGRHSLAVRAELRYQLW